ncbi:hypothetical protein K440DRAFT_556131 [Wilcoxina mikolae CBS 423.85]|nr:hypothetical protein K440DRAFT_556131 [Wilcoxina mikolae CBS 423.85]
MSLFGAPTCRSCTQRLASGATQQIRHKSKMVKSSTISVRLLQDVPKLGRKGTIVQSWSLTSIPLDTMYPFKKAEYMTAAALKRIPAAELVQQPDVTFRPDLEDSKKVEINLNLLKPVHTISLLEGFLPPKIMFSRPTIAPTEVTIHGSISTNDICIAVKSIAAANGDEGSRIVITPDMISFLDPNIKGDKVKTLGEHKFEIRMKGSVKPVIRSVDIAQQVSLE